MADTDGQPVSSNGELDDEPAPFHGEESGDERSTPTKNLGAAIVIAAVAIYAMVEAVGFETPNTVYTAPGLLPFLTGATLLVMALYLGVLAVRHGGATDVAGRVARSVSAYFKNEEDRRTLMLMGIVLLYVLLVGWIDFTLRLPTPLFDFQISSFEVISVPLIAIVLWIFWRAPAWRCTLVSLVLIEALANTFRSAFYILMPTGG
jgi:hypothetical protein